jgi:hypothetical protein
MSRHVVVALASVSLLACGDDGGETAPTVAFDLDGELAGDTFWELPFPSDLRLTAAGTPDLAGYPTRQSPLALDLLEVAAARRGFPVMPVTYLRFTAAPPPQGLAAVIPATGAQPIEMFAFAPGDTAIDPARRVPLVVKTLVEDDFAPASLVAIAPLPGFVLDAATTYAVVVRRSFAPGFAPPAAFAELVAGRTPAGTRGPAAATLYAPLVALLGDTAGDALVATVFTTGDEVAMLHARTEAILAAEAAVIADLRVDPVDGAAHDGFCELVGTVAFPQFQAGEQPFDTLGSFVLDDAGVPIAQGTMTVPLAITIPVGERPANGWPLYQFFHGSGGLSSGVVDLGKTLVVGGEPEVGKGPGYVVARHGIAAVSSALPVNPERLPGAEDTEYLNLQNLSAFPFTFQQGVIEQRLLLRALLALEIPSATLASCAGVTLPSGEMTHFFDPEKVVAGGQSMGGAYTNLVASVEERYGAVVPTGAGGYWNYMITTTQLIPGALEFLAAAFGTDAGEFSFVHPALNLLALGWEVADPMAAVPRVALRPLPGMPHRNVYEPVGFEDIYFPPVLYDAMALAYGNQQVGDEVWPTMQDVLAYGGRAGLATYPVSENVADAGGGSHTGVVVQYASDGIADSHYLYRQSDAVKHQYGCFLASFLATGTAVVPAPGAPGDPCE